MNEIPWGTAAAIFLGTLPLLGMMVWNLVEIKTFRGEVRAEFTQIRTETAGIRGEIANIHTELKAIRERLATLEERNRPTILKK